MLLVVDGAIAVSCGKERFADGRGGFVFLPRGVPHSWDVTTGTARVLIITVPGGLEEFLREFDAAGAARSAVGPTYGIEFVRTTGTDGT